MGDYYTLRFNVPLSEFGLGIVQRMVQEPWARWKELTEFPEGVAFAQLFDRADFIPLGGLAYEPDGWEEKVNCIVQVGEGLVWRASCSVKIAPFTRQLIDHFFSVVAPALSSGRIVGLVHNELEPGVLEKSVKEPGTELFSIRMAWMNDDVPGDWYSQMSEQHLGW